MVGQWRRRGMAAAGEMIQCSRCARGQRLPGEGRGRAKTAPNFGPTAKSRLGAGSRGGAEGTRGGAGVEGRRMWECSAHHEPEAQRQTAHGVRGPPK